MPRCRRRHPRARPLGVVGAVLTVLVVAACGGPRSVTLSELAADAEHYDGRHVVASGIVVEFGGEGGRVQHHYVIQDGDLNRVELLPAERVAPHVGSAVEVTGEFAFDPDVGRVLHIDTIAPVTVER